MKYDILVIGGGAGGLVTAAGSKGVGASVALIERNLLGGDCLVNGCVPSKAFLRAANLINACRNAKEHHADVGDVKVNFAEVMNRMEKIRAGISDNDSAFRFSKALGVDLFLGQARFTSKSTVEVNG